jgi:hypothetical protein
VEGGGPAAATEEGAAGATPPARDAVAVELQRFGAAKELKHTMEAGIAAFNRRVPLLCSADTCAA